MSTAVTFTNSGATHEGALFSLPASSQHSSRNSSALIEDAPDSSTRKNSCSSPMRRFSAPVVPPPSEDVGP